MLRRFYMCLGILAQCLDDVTLRGDALRIKTSYRFCLLVRVDNESDDNYIKVDYSAEDDLAVDNLWDNLFLGDSDNELVLDFFFEGNLLFLSKVSQ